VLPGQARNVITLNRDENDSMRRNVMREKHKTVKRVRTGRRPISVTLPPELVARLDEEAEQERRSRATRRVRPGEVVRSARLATTTRHADDRRYDAGLQAERRLRFSQPAVERRVADQSRLALALAEDP